MDGVFSSAKNVYHTNFLEYSTTGEPKYKKAYEAALQSMDSTLASLQAQVSSIPQPHESAHTLERSLIHEKDKVTEAKMRVPIDLSPSPSMYWRYITAGVLICFAAGIASL